MRWQLTSGAVCLVLAMLAGTAEAAKVTTTRVMPVAVVNGDGTTTFRIRVCVCMNADALAAYLEAVGNGAEPAITLNIGGLIGVVENDDLNDDELQDAPDDVAWGQTPEGGGMTVAMPPMPEEGWKACPPWTNDICVVFPSPKSCSTDAYDDDAPGDPPGEFQMEDSNGDEGKVPPGTTVTTPGGNTSVPEFP